MSLSLQLECYKYRNWLSRPVGVVRERCAASLPLRPLLRSLEHTGALSNVFGWIHRTTFQHDQVGMASLVLRWACDLFKNIILSLTQRGTVDHLHLLSFGAKLMWCESGRVHSSSRKIPGLALGEEFKYSFCYFIAYAYRLTINPKVWTTVFQ